MKLTWTEKSVTDLRRLHDFLSRVNPLAGARAAQSLVKNVGLLPTHPRIGEKLDRYLPREVRRLIVGRYEVRYEINEAGIHVLRIWHTRENR